MSLPVVEERLRVFEDVARAAASGDRCLIHRHLKLRVEQVSDHTVGNEGPLQLQHTDKSLMSNYN